MMRYRKNFLPRSSVDIGCYLMLFIFIPVTFIFELVVVLPEFHDTSGFFYKLTCVVACFVLFNLKGNMLCTMLVDTSIKNEILTPPVQRPLRNLWHFCSECETLVPPRSWHCKTCKTCILKRDHHCQYIGCCIGHKNHRFFVLFMIYLVIGTAYTSLYTSVYIWVLNWDYFYRMSTIMKIICPMLIFPLDASWLNLYLLIYEMNVLAFSYAIVLIMYHFPITLSGGLLYERSPYRYDQGWRRNLEMVLGNRMFFTWLSPLIKSDLPHDGIHWETILHDSSKDR